MTIWLILTILAIALFIYILFRKFENSKKWLKLILALGSFILIGFTLFKYLVPLYPSPEPKGAEKVLTDAIYFKHETNFPKMSTDGKEREIPVDVWYPENLEKSKHPLMLFSHGAFGVGLSNETMYKELASRGYIVMSLNHPYHSFFAKMSNGTEIKVDFGFMKEVLSSQGVENLKKTLDSLNNWLDIRLEDINYVVDKLLDTETDNKYENYIDSEHIVLSGHSLGGSAMLALGREHPEKFTSLVILESPFVKDITGIENNKYTFVDEKYPLPVLHIYSDAIYDRLSEITTYDMNYRLIKANNPKYRNVRISGVGHIGLTDMALTSPFFTNMIDGGLNSRKAPETLLEINDIVLDFLGEYNK